MALCDVDAREFELWARDRAALASKRIENYHIMPSAHNRYSGHVEAQEQYMGAHQHNLSLKSARKQRTTTPHTLSTVFSVLSTNKFSQPSDKVVTMAHSRRKTSRRKASRRRSRSAKKIGLRGPFCDRRNATKCT